MSYSDDSMSYFFDSLGPFFDSLEALYDSLEALYDSLEPLCDSLDCFETSQVFKTYEVCAASGEEMSSCPSTSKVTGN